MFTEMTGPVNLFVELLLFIIIKLIRPVRRVAEASASPEHGVLEVLHIVMS